MDMAAAAACAGEEAPSLPAAMANPVPPACPHRRPGGAATTLVQRAHPVPVRQALLLP